MKIKYLTLLLSVLLAGCATQQPPAPPKQEPPQPQPVVVVSQPKPSPNEIDELLSYHQSLILLPRAEIVKELDKLELQAKSPKLGIKKAMALALLGRKGDLALAQFYLQDAVSGENPIPQNLRAFTQMLSSNFATAQRLTDQLEKTDRQLNESQRNAEHLSRMLDELKAIERALPARRGNVP